MCRSDLCSNCNGACCRSVRIKVGPMSQDQMRWARMRGTLNKGGQWRIRSVCEHLTDAGRCGIYETRPTLCREWVAGGAQCREARGQ